MARPKKSNNDTNNIRHLLEQYLRQREPVTATRSAVSQEHFDEDTLSVFIEGRLSPAESAPLISHLVGCHFCRRATVQLIRLESALGASEIMDSVPSEEPGRIRRLLDALAARVLPASNEEIVFAYHAPAEDLAQAEKSSEEAREKKKRDEKLPSEPLSVHDSSGPGAEE